MNSSTVKILASIRTGSLFSSSDSRRGGGDGSSSGCGSTSSSDGAAAKITTVIVVQQPHLHIDALDRFRESVFDHDVLWPHVNLVFEMFVIIRIVEIATPHDTKITTFFTRVEYFGLDGSDDPGTNLVGDVTEINRQLGWIGWFPQWKIRFLFSLVTWIENAQTGIVTVRVIVLVNIITVWLIFQCRTNVKNQYTIPARDRKQSFVAIIVTSFYFFRQKNHVAVMVWFDGFNMPRHKKRGEEGGPEGIRRRRRRCGGGGGRTPSGGGGGSDDATAGTQQDRSRQQASQGEQKTKDGDS